MKDVDDRRDMLAGTKPIYRLGVVCLGLLMLATGVLVVMNGRTHFQNYWGAPVFAPFAIVIGLLIIVAMIISWVRDR